MAYFAGLIDGDGHFDKKRSDLRIFYGKNEKEKVEADKQLLKILNIEAKIKERKNHFALIVYKPTSFMRSISKFLVLPRKRLT